MECASRIWPFSSCRTNDLLPCRTPTRPRHRGAPCLPVASPRPPASTPMSRTFFRPRKGVKIPMALLPPPTHATTAAGNPPPLGEPHPDDVRFLATDIFRAHVDHAGNPHLRAYRRGGDPVLPRPRLGDDPTLFHPSRQDTRAERVVDLVGARVGEILPLEEDVRPFSLFREAAREVEGGRTAAVLPEQAVQVRQESLVPGHLPVCLLQADERSHQRFRHVPPPAGAEVPRPAGPP